MSHPPFKEKVILITGASSGIGRAIAAACARQGAHVGLLSRNGDKLRDIEQQLSSQPGQHLALPTDVRDPVAVQRAVNSVLDHFGRLDVLINNAGVGYCGTIEQMSFEDLHEVMQTNFYGPFHAMRAVLPHMIQRRNGLIIQITSVNGFCAIPLGGAYCASKFALEALSQSARFELVRHGIRVLIVRPGVTDTNFFDNARNFRATNPFPLRHLMPAEVAADKILAAAAHGKRELTLTAEGRMMWWLKKLAPRFLDLMISQYVKERTS